jgi:hypothetical protein
VSGKWTIERNNSVNMQEEKVAEAKRKNGRLPDSTAIR